MFNMVGMGSYRMGKAAYELGGIDSLVVTGVVKVSSTNRILGG